MLNIVVPMAGAGSRFAQQGYQLPKPLIPIFDEPMIRVAIENIRPRRPHRFIFIGQQAHLESYALADRLRGWCGPQTVVAPTPGLTEGAACTVLLAKTLINSDTPLMIANCDQWVNVSIDDYLDEMDSRGLDGSIMTLNSRDPKWSYAALDSSGLVRQVAEKKVISEHATVGIYAFARGADFVAAAERMIARNERVNGEFYVAPAYGPMIDDGAKIGAFFVGREDDGMHGLGTPQDVDRFLRNPVASRAVAFRTMAERS